MRSLFKLSSGDSVRRQNMVLRRVLMSISFTSIRIGHFRRIGLDGRIILSTISLLLKDKNARFTRCEGKNKAFFC